ncbi:hypothetical protein HDF26_002812 [Pedobacter cryoconitis]|uniref:DoxX-like protein n=1 Tax=Pedobacter cryoconitis TaxID=188932 RepID=A0A7W8ZII1_9SPHI|nr:DoxX family protein [Pedobacter cryoconitis]MBB5634520.1 hypothetical protein [Pedobacter cryoconitis]MBB6272355.1 hypothetical protein [Pedobacter cryoconitis]
MNLKSIKIIYWITTVLLALFILPGIFFMNSPMALEGTQHLGLPHWFHEEVSIGSFIGGLILILPKLPPRLKEWAYVALGIVYISAFIAHLSVDGVIPMSFMPVVVFIVLLISYLCYHKLLKHANS